jgi:hypothetical protein
MRGADDHSEKTPQIVPARVARPLARRRRAARLGRGALSALWGTELLFFIYFKRVLFTWSSYTPANSLRSCGADAASDL